MSVLVDNTVNCTIEFILSNMENESYYFKDMIKQPDWTDFVKAMEKKLTYMDVEALGIMRKVRHAWWNECHFVLYRQGTHLIMKKGCALMVTKNNGEWHTWSHVHW